MRLTKHHGWGNDFLVVLDPNVVADGELARRLCDRHRGVGADGLIHGVVSGEGGTDADAVMVLFNADGSRAEMSGNGIRCLAQALLLAGLVEGPTLEIDTEAGRRRLEVKPGPGTDAIDVRVDMGPAGVDLEPSLPAGEAFGRAALVDVGNPHLVVQADPGTVDLATVGPRLASAFPAVASEVNVEIAELAGDGSVAMRVWERGVGETAACGTGVAAVAAAFRAWDLVGPTVEVRQPGGAAEVTVADTVTLTGPAVYVATVEVPWP